MIETLYHGAPAELLELEWLGESWVWFLYLDTPSTLCWQRYKWTLRTWQLPSFTSVVNHSYLHCLLVITR